MPKGVYSHCKVIKRNLRSEKERFEKFVMPEPNSGCWLWMGYVNPKGYGTFKGTTENRAHRASYTIYKGPISDGLQIDHLCGVRSCVNSDHLEAVSSKENNYRIPNYFGKRTQCRNGHPYDGINTYNRPDGRGRECRACRKLRPNLKEGDPNRMGFIS